MRSQPDSHPEPAPHPAGPSAQRQARHPVRSLALFLLFYAGVLLSHLALLRLPYYWDEGGYYIPAAYDFFGTGTLIPEFTNAHPPLPNILIGSLWHLTGLSVLATRLLVCAFAAAALLAVFRLAQRFLGNAPAWTLALLTAVYPIWFAQSSLAHADIFAACFTLWGFVVVFRPLPALASAAPPPSSLTREGPLAAAVLFTLAALSKETAILQPLLLALVVAVLAFRARRQPYRRPLLVWLAALCVPVLPLAAWFAYHHAKTGFTFGNPEFLRYNATANLSAAHITTALRYRLVHLFWQRNIWLPLLLAGACLFLPRRPAGQSRQLPRSVLLAIAVLVVGNWLAFSVLGGALLTRYLLPVYPLLLLVCVWLWQRHTVHWPWFAGATAVAFLSALWINPPTSFAPEDNLTYRDMIVVHQEAIRYVVQHYPGATILTAWPVAADLFRPELGYVSHPQKVTSLDNFSLSQIRKAATEPGNYDTAIVFTTHYTTPALAQFLLAHPDTARGREFASTRDLTPREIALQLGGRIVWQDDRDGEWAAVLRFPRSYDAQVSPPAPLARTGR